MINFFCIATRAGEIKIDQKKKKKLKIYVRINFFGSFNYRGRIVKKNIFY